MIYDYYFVLLLFFMIIVSNEFEKFRIRTCHGVRSRSAIVRFHYGDPSIQLQRQLRTRARNDFQISCASSCSGRYRTVDEYGPYFEISKHVRMERLVSATILFTQKTQAMHAISFIQTTGLKPNRTELILQTDVVGPLSLVLCEY